MFCPYAEYKEDMYDIKYMFEYKDKIFCPYADFNMNFDDESRNAFNMKKNNYKVDNQTVCFNREEISNVRLAKLGGKALNATTNYMIDKVAKEEAEKYAKEKAGKQAEKQVVYKAPVNHVIDKQIDVFRAMLNQEAAKAAAKAGGKAS